MAKVLARTKDMSREEWLELRRRGIGGSDITVIAGLNPWQSPMALYLEKTGQVPDREPTEPMEWGLRLEALVADWFAEQDERRRVQRVNAILQHPDHPWALANVDRRVYVRGEEPGILEIKTTSEWMRGDWEDGKAPLYAQAQLQWYLGVTGYSRGWIAALIGGRRYVEVEIQRDQQVIDHLLEMAERFWQCVETGTPPEWDGSEASTELLTRMYPEGDADKSVLLPLEAEALIRQIEEAREEEKAAEARRKEAENRLKALLGEAEVGLIAGEPAVTWRTVASQRLDTKRLRGERPDIYEEYAKPSTYRRLQINGKRGA